MAMIKCSECGKEISDKASVCTECGAPIPLKQDTVATPVVRPDFENLGDLTGDGRVDFEDFKVAYTKIKESLPEVQDTEEPKVDK